MKSLLCLSWRYLIIRGLAALAFGLAAMAWPGLTLALLILMFGAFVLLDGLLALVSGFQHKDLDPQWWVIALQGLTGVVIGIMTFAWPAATGMVILLLIAAWALLTGTLQVVTALRLRQEIQGEWFYVLSGAVSIIFGLLLVARPGAGAMAVITVIGFFAILAGILQLTLGFKLRGLAGEIERSP